MADTGFRAASASQNNFNFTTPDNAFVSDDARAILDATSDSVEYITFGFNGLIPAGNQIDGIELAVEERYTGAGVNHSFDWRLSWNLGTNFTASKNKAVSSIDTDATDTVGGAADTWGRTWAIADFNDANFAVEVTGSSFSVTTMEIDLLQCKVYYSLIPTATGIGWVSAIGGWF